MSTNPGTPIIIIGARFNGHAGVVEGLISSSSNFSVYGYIDDDPALLNKSHKGKSVLGSGDILDEIFHEKHVKHAIVALGDNDKREEYILKLTEIGYGVPNIIHKSAVIAEDSTLGKGCVIAPGAVIMNGVNIGDGVTINTGTTIDHNCVLEGYDNISPGTHFSGRVHVEKCVFMGTGTIIIPDIHIGHHSYIGAGSVVIRDVPHYSKIAGVPAKKI
jgi:sugar O-acyltransferase (sialic acid O-acetyltransferase NeuD family)